MRRWLVSVVWMAMAPMAQAQVSIYGQLNVAWRQSTHVDPLGSSRAEIGGTNQGTGIFGLRGAEPLGGGWQMRWRLENGFFMDTGAQRNAGPFGREASLGIDSPFGKWDVGRLQLVGGAAESLVRADPLRGNGQIETVWPGIWTGARYDGAIRYRYESGPALVGLMFAPGRAGKTNAFTAGWLGEPLTVFFALQDMRDAADLSSRASTLGLTYQAANWTLHGAWLQARRDKNFLIGATSGTALFNTDIAVAGIRAPARLESEVWLAGLTLPMGAWRLRAARIWGNSPNATLFSATRGGTQRSAYAVLSYHFSTRTNVMLGWDDNQWRGGWSGYWGASPASLAAYRPDGRDSRRTVHLGMQHGF